MHKAHQRDLNIQSSHEGKNWLLSIGIDAYQQCLPLNNAVRDVQTFTGILIKKYGFRKDRLITYIDEAATKEGIWMAFDQMEQQIGEEDNLIIYYAGHGELNEHRDWGYWLPVDAQPDKEHTYIRNRDIIDFIRGFRCKHLVLISDSCFSGAFFSELRRGNNSFTKGKSRYALTSGRKQRVLDGHNGEGSPFAQYLVQFLEESREPLFFHELAQKVAIATDAHTEMYQTPRGEPLNIKGHEGGQFLFVPQTLENPSLDSQPLLEKDFWKQVQKEDSLQAYQGYLESFPHGKFSSIALPRVRRLQRQAEKQNERHIRQIQFSGLLEEAQYQFEDRELEEALNCCNAAEDLVHIPIDMENLLSLKKKIEGELNRLSLRKGLSNSKEFLQDLGIELVEIEGGSFKMGSKNKKDYKASPIHKVEISSYYLGKYPVTVGQFQSFLAVTDYQTEAEKVGRSKVLKRSGWDKKRGVNWRYSADGKQRIEVEFSYPVVHISWNDAQAFCKWLSDETGWKFSLPTEAQWEYAARGGKYSKGSVYSGSEKLKDVGWYWKNSGDKDLSGGWDKEKIFTNNCATHPIGYKQPNELGLYDMSGNVFEWCQDWFKKYSPASSKDPLNLSKGKYRVLRGGSWYSDASNCRVACRSYGHPDACFGAIGF
ncbi:MAG: SUMF1/EgtB/PvdO family nonheme iron enzyme, partial [Bacteroidota bacterium]